jgi:uncharacterized protein
MRFEWDEAKNLGNQRKHSMCFEDALAAFFDPLLVMVPDRVVDQEQRWQTFGVVRQTLLMVAHTSRDEAGDEIIRIISARRATRHERKRYENENG